MIKYMRLINQYCSTYKSFQVVCQSWEEVKMKTGQSLPCQYAPGIQGFACIWVFGFPGFISYGQKKHTSLKNVYFRTGKSGNLDTTCLTYAMYSQLLRLGTARGCGTRFFPPRFKACKSFMLTKSSNCLKVPIV